MNLSFNLNRLAFVAAAVFSGLLLFGVSVGIPLVAATLFCLALGLAL